MIRWLALALLTIGTTAQAQFVFSPWPKIEEPKPAAVTLYKEIDEKSAAVVIEAIHEQNKLHTSLPILMYLNSPGGNVLAGTMIVDAMEASRRTIVTVNIGLCASMCATIFEHGRKRLALPSSVLMFHEAHGGTEGDMSHMASQIVLWSKIIARGEEYIAQRASMDVRELRAREQLQWWLLADEAVKASLADAVVKIADYPAPKE